MALQAIFIRAREDRREEGTSVGSRLKGGLVTYYRVECHGRTKIHHVWRRYNDFVKLDHDLLDQSSGHEPPPGRPLPPKSRPLLAGQWRREGSSVDGFLEERQYALERYLRAILSSPDDRWTRTQAWSQFLELENEGNAGSDGTDFGLGKTSGPSIISNSSSWTIEYQTISKSMRSIRIRLVNQTSHFAEKDAVTSAQIGHALMSLGSRITSLQTSLDILASKETLSQLELDRRIDLCERLASEREALISTSQKISQDRRTSHQTSITASSADQNRQELFGGNREMGGGSKPAKGQGRILGQPSRETSITRAIPTTGLLDLQSSQMKEQDASLDTLAAIIARQKTLGLAIQSEVASQNELLDRLTIESDQFDSKLKREQKQIKRL